MWITFEPLSASLYTINICVISIRPSLNSSLSFCVSSRRASCSSPMRGSFSNLISTILVSPLLLFPILVSAEIRQIGFTTDDQTLSPGELSGTITIQLQDASGSPAQANETFDIQFVSTSALGEFLSPTTENEVTKTLSTGSANKNFRYRDRLQGTHTLTVNARGRVSGLEVSGEQSIVISSSSSPNSITPNNSANSTQPTSSSNPLNSSAHYSSQSVNSKKSEIITSLSAGRDRLGSVGSPLEFKAETNLSYRKNVQFRWNFGDGSEDYGEELTHTYEYPGDYIVVLNAITPEGRAIARTSVKIVAPQLDVIFANSQRIEVRNSTKQEISLFGSALWAHGKSFLFPQDTLIKPGQSISFASRVTGLRPNATYEVQLLTLGQTEQPKINEKIEALKQDKILDLQYKIWELQEEIASRKVLPALPTSPVVSTPIQPETSPDVAIAIESLDQEGGESKSGWLATLKKFFLGNNKK